MGGGRLGLSEEADLSALQLVRAELNELRLMRSNIGILGRSILWHIRKSAHFFLHSKSAAEEFKWEAVCLNPRQRKLQPFRR